MFSGLVKGVASHFHIGCHYKFAITSIGYGDWRYGDSIQEMGDVYAHELGHTMGMR